MLYAMLIYESEAGFARRTDPAERDAYWAEWQAFGPALREAGVMAGGKALQPPATATTLRFQGGESVVQDGPYADTKEQLGGFILLDVPDLDAALRWASRAPRLPGLVLELRPVVPPPAEAPCGG